MPENIETNQSEKPAETQETPVSVGKESVSSEDAVKPEIDFNKDYRNFLPDELKKEKVFDNVPDLQTLAKNYKESQAYILQTRKSVPLPKDDAPDEEWTKFHQSNGAFDEPGKYTVTMEEVEGVQWEDTKLDKFKELSHRIGLTQRQVSELSKWYSGDVKQQLSDLQELRAQERENADALLLQEWGTKRNFERNMGRIDLFLNKVLTPEERQYFQQNGVEHDPVFRRMMAKIAKNNVEDSAVSSSAKGWMTKEDAKSTLNELKKSEPYLNAGHPDHTTTRKKVLELYQYVYDDNEGATKRAVSISV